MLTSTLFWLTLLVLAIAGIRSFFPHGGFDEVRTGEVPLELGTSDDGLWVLNYADHSVSLVNPSDEEILFTTEVGADVAPALAANDEGAWVLLDAGDTLGRIDPAGGEIAERIDLTTELDDPGQDLAAADGVVWVTTGEGGQMARIDTGSAEIDQTVDVGGSVGQPELLDASLWVNESAGLAEYDAASGERLQVLDTEHRIHDFVVDENGIWLLADIDNFEETGLVVQLDPSDGDEQGRLRITEAQPSHITTVDDHIFVSASGGQLVELSIDPLGLVGADQVAASTKDLRAVVALGGRVWIADGTNGVAHRAIDDGSDYESDPDVTVPA